MIFHPINHLVYIEELVTENQQLIKLQLIKKEKMLLQDYQTQLLWFIMFKMVMLFLHMKTNMLLVLLP